MQPPKRVHTKEPPPLLPDVCSFIGSKTFTSFVPGSLDLNTGSANADYEGLLPFIHGSTKQMDAGNRAVASFRHHLSDLMANARVSGTRGATTNWGFPMAMARAIEI